MKTITDRQIAALLNPRLAVLVTCCDADGAANVLTVAWHTPLSHQPPLVGISIGCSRYSHALIRQTGEFAINIVGPALLEAVRQCGTYTGELDDKLGLTGLEVRPAEQIRPPVLQDALGILECRVSDRVEAGDHTFFVGQVLLAQAREDCFSKAWETDVLQVLQRDRYGSFLETDG